VGPLPGTGRSQAILADPAMVAAGIQIIREIAVSDCQ